MKQTRTSMKLEMLGQHVLETLKNELHFLMHELIKCFQNFIVQPVNITILLHVVNNVWSGTFHYNSC